MININISDTGNTFSLYVRDLPKGGLKFLMVLYNDFLKQEKRFILTDTSSINKNTFIIQITNDPSLEDLTIPKLYLHNWVGYNKYKIYYNDGIVTSYTMSETYLISQGYMYIYDDRTCYEPITGTTTLDYEFNYICDI